MTLIAFDDDDQPVEICRDCLEPLDDHPTCVEDSSDSLFTSVAESA